MGRIPPGGGAATLRDEVGSFTQNHSNALLVLTVDSLVRVSRRVEGASPVLIVSESFWLAILFSGSPYLNT